MTWGVITAKPETKIRQAAAMMQSSTIGALPVAEHGKVSLPVVDNGKLVGMRTERDVLWALSRERGALPVSPEGFLW